jgi:hypothetical protein
MGRFIGPNSHQEIMHQRYTTLDERGSSVADLFPSWERLSEEPKKKPIAICRGDGAAGGQHCHAEHIRYAQCKLREASRGPATLPIELSPCLLLLLQVVLPIREGKSELLLPFSIIH